MSRATTIVGQASCAALLLIGGERANAQIDTSAQWRYAVTPYGWTLSLHGRVGVGPVATNADISFHDILKALKFAAMVNGEVRRGPWMGTIDVIYSSLRNTSVLAFRGDTGSLELTQKIAIVQPLAGYTIGNQAWAVDFLGGFRYWYLKTTIDVDVTKRPTNPHSLSRNWPDATAGFRFRWVPYPKLHVVAGGDGGGGGSHGTWQAYATVGYDVWSKVALGAGYRYLSVNYEHDSFLFDTRLRGLGLGATIHW